MKVVQIDTSGKRAILEGYGTCLFDPNAISDGEIVNYEAVAKAAHMLFSENIVGSISTDNIAASLPVTHSFNRIISLPIMDDKDVLEAIKLEAEQYIPIPITQLYFDYFPIAKEENSQDFLVSAAPKRVVDSYMNLFDILGLRTVVIEPSILSVTRTVKMAESSNFATLIIDCGSLTSDLIIYDKGVVRVTGTVKFGGNAITRALVAGMGLTESQANTVKSKYGLEYSKKQTNIKESLDTPLKGFIAEIKKVLRYFEDRSAENSNKVEQIVLLGGGANMPGFSTYLTDNLRVPTRLCAIWQNIDLDGLQPPNNLDTTMYATAAGLALIKPGEVTV